jgi:hypothetical protein
VIEDQQPPAGEILADIGACQVDGAVRFLAAGHVPEERAGFGKFSKDTLVQVELVLIRIDGNFGFIRSILVEDNEMEIPEIFTNTMYKPQVGTALPALMALKSHAPAPGTVLVVWALKKAPGRS